MVEVAPPPAEEPNSDLLGRKGPWERSGADRRRRPTPMLSGFLLRGRRRGGRREGEILRVYVDRPGPWVLTAFLALTLLSLADAYFTLYELSRGGTEANPVMRAALSLGNGGFVAVKTAVTIAGVAFLALHKNWPLGKICLVFALVGYAALTAWHLYGVLILLPSLPA